MRKWTAAVPVVMSFGLSAALFSRLPESARPDFSALTPFELPPSGPVGRMEAALLLPAVALAVWLLLAGLGKMTKSVNRFAPTYETIIFGVTALVFLMHAATLAAMLSLPAWTFQVITACVGLGMIAIGNVLPRTRPNWIAGVRTKETLSDPLVWSRTHRLAGMLLIIAGIIVIAASVFAPAYAIVTAIVLLLISFPIAHYRATELKTQCLT